MAATVKTKAPSILTLNLFAPGMSMLHRAGLGGLACSLKAMERDVRAKQWKAVDCPGGKWTNEKPPWMITEQSITLEFGEAENAAEWLKALFLYSFQTKEDLFFLPGQYQKTPPSHPIRAYLQQGITLTFLQHGLTRELAKNATPLSYNPDEDPKKSIQYEFKACMSYKHQNGWKDLTDNKGRLSDKAIEVVGPLCPGAVVRHNAFAGPTKLKDVPALILPLNFALIGCLPLSINRGCGVLLVPDVVDLTTFPAVRQAMTPTTTRECQITVASDAALQTQLRIRAKTETHKAALPTCHAVTFQPTPWASQQKSRVDTITVPAGREECLNQFSIAMNELRPRIVSRDVEESSGRGKAKVVTKRTESFWVDSIVRPLVATNLARGQPWYQGFVDLMTKMDPVSKKPKRMKLFFEKEGLKAMTEKIMWQDQGEGAIVRAVHEAMKRLYGRIAKDYEKNPVGRRNKWKREFERWRLLFAGAKTSDQLRKAFCDFMSRAGMNSVLQEHWSVVLPWITSTEKWQLTRDLSLLALASYSGTGAKEIELPLDETAAITE